MKRTEAQSLAKELCNRYGRTVFIHTDAATKYNIRFDAPIESLRQVDGPVQFAPTTLEKYELIDGFASSVSVPMAGDKPRKCPTCGSPAPHLHPAMQFEGEVQPCKNPWHLQVTPQNTPERIAETQKIIELA